MILILGKHGQMSSALAHQLGNNALAISSDQLNFTEPNLGKKLTEITQSQQINAVINAAAYNFVDKAETETELAMRINGTAVGEIAEWCKEKNLTYVHYSTDYVFDGSGDRPHIETDATGPLSAYGRSKTLGETLVAKSGAKHFIFRTSWVYDAIGKNFLNTMRRLFKEREEVSVVADQYGAPTYAAHLAVATISALNVKNAPSGIYHLCNSGVTTWHGFAQAIFALASTHESGIKCQRVQPITTSEYPTPAKRPANCRLSCSKAQNTFGVTMPDWMNGLNECYESIRLRH